MRCRKADWNAWNAERYASPPKAQVVLEGQPVQVTGAVAHQLDGSEQNHGHAPVLTDGLYKVQIAVDAKRFGVSAWWLTLVLAVAAGTVGLALVFRPWDSARLLTILLGAALVAEGILNLCVAISTVKIVNLQVTGAVAHQLDGSEQNHGHAQHPADDCGGQAGIYDTSDSGGTEYQGHDDVAGLGHPHGNG